MFEWCEDFVCQVATPRCFEGEWVSRVSHGVLVYGHGHRLERGRCFYYNGLEYMCYAEVLPRRPGFPVRDWRWAVLRS